ncbi:zinc ABC transporter substrate-binding protein [Candidatus Uhrbacteria bacterium]|nr:zinc ABC transporter substrate-binding protein [Candidatus Uhrbacteria bacterium]
MSRAIVKRISAVVLVISVLTGMAVVLLRRDATAPPTTDAAVTIAASFYPLAEFTRQVGGALVRVTNLTPPGVEPHEFEPAPQQIARISQSDLLVFNGGGVDAWASRLASSLARTGTRVLEMRPHMGALLPAAVREERSGRFDEHFWLSPVLAQKEVEVIRDALIEIDPTHADVYRTNAAVYLQELRELDHAFAQGLASCRLRVAVTSHAAFGYLAHAYGFTQIPITGISPDEEPSAGALAAIARQAKTRGVRYVLFETLVSPKLAQTLAREIGAQTLVFNPLEGLTEEEMASGKHYISVMRENLATLRTAMVCE